MKKVLYLGTDPKLFHEEGKDIYHCPLIEVKPRDINHFSINHQLEDFPSYTHLLLTSKHSVELLVEALMKVGFSLEILKEKTCIVIGESTSKTLESYGSFNTLKPSYATQEGMMDLLDTLDCEHGYFFYPRSSRARPALSYYLRVRKLRHQVCDLYDTHLKGKEFVPSLEAFDEVIFTSPSTVEAFFSNFCSLPSHLVLRAIGPITEASLRRHLPSFC